MNQELLKTRYNWISVSERLPEPGVQVLIWIEEDNFGYDIATYEPNSNLYNWNCIGELSMYKKPIYWAYLIPPPLKHQ